MGPFFVMVYFWTQYFVLLVYLSIFAPALYFLDYFNFIINLMSSFVSLLPLFFLIIFNSAFLF